ncbi:MAG: hypothetical protein ACC651_17070, partial [Candidatus Scalindua sp.]
IKFTYHPDSNESKKKTVHQSQRAQRKTKNRVFRIILFLNLLNHRNNTNEKENVLKNLHPLRSPRLLVLGAFCPGSGEFFF